MTQPIEDYALIGDTQTGALVGRDGSIDWLCLPRFDSGACFSALLGTPEHGRWLLAPAGGVERVERRYRDGTLVLETDFITDGGAVRVTDLMPPRERDPDVVRIVVGLRGRVEMQMELVIRFDYGSIVPWVRSLGGALRAIGGPDALTLHTPVATHGENLRTVASFSVSEGDRVPFTLIWHPSTESSPEPIDALAAVEDADRWWCDWTEHCSHEGEWRDAVVRSLLTLKALTYGPTGGIVAAPTTSLPERIGGVRNWDYRFCWIRDAAFTLDALVRGGYEREAREWRDWLLRAASGHPAQIGTMYGVGGERRLPELELDWLPGYEGSAPVRIGNAAAQQFQLDVFGELMDALGRARDAGMEPDPESWNLQRALMDHLEGNWREPDEGIWEVRSDPRQFTHSKVMAWVAVDRAIRAVEHHGLDGPVEDWRRLRGEIFDEVCEEGFSAKRGAFVQSYGSSDLDASLLMLPLVGFVGANDERMLGTVRAIEQELCQDGFVMRYSHADEDCVDGLPPGEGAFLPCTFWLADNLALAGRVADARALYERLLEVRNDVGLLSEEYDPVAERLLGNFPQAFSHVELINTACILGDLARDNPGA